MPWNSCLYFSWSKGIITLPSSLVEAGILSLNLKLSADHQPWNPLRRTLPFRNILDFSKSGPLPIPCQNVLLWTACLNFLFWTLRSAPKSRGRGCSKVLALLSGPSGYRPCWGIIAGIMLGLIMFQKQSKSIHNQQRIRFHRHLLWRYVVWRSLVQSFKVQMAVHLEGLITHL